MSWWHDYMRAELDRAHEFYADQFRTTPTDEPDTFCGYYEMSEEDTKAPASDEQEVER